MPLADAFQPQNDTAIENLLSQPEPPPKIAPAKSSVWSTISAAPRAMAAAAAETLAGATEIVTAVGRSNMPGNIMNRAGPEVRGDYGAMTSEASRSLRNVADEYRPDPLTAGTAENLVFGVTKGLTKAIGATLAAGPLGGAAVFGTDQGLTKFDDLQREGVDDQTAAKVGFLEGVTSGASLLVPVAAGGATTAAAVAKTAGLVAVAGPGAFIAQQAATREILRGADYAGIAETYDPLDPVGLAVATLIPAVFGGMHVRAGMKARAEAAPAARVEPTLDASGRIDESVNQSTPLETGSVNQVDPRVATDAAMTHNLTLLHDEQARRAPQYLNLPMPEQSRLQPDPTTPVAEVKPAPVPPRPEKVEYVDTRGQGSRFHGTSRQIKSLSDDYAMSGDNRNIYGQGFYTTDAVDISAGYMKKGRGGDSALYQVEHSDVPLYDMDAPLTPEMREGLRQAVGDSDYTGEDSMIAKASSLRDWFDEFRGESQNFGLSRDDVQEVWDSVRYQLDDKGFRGYRHAAGDKTGNAAHDVKIFWYPEQDATITKVDAMSYAKKAPRDDATKPAAQPAAEPVDPTVARAAEVDPVEMAAVSREAQEGTDTELGHLDTDLLRVAAECAITTATA